MEMESPNIGPPGSGTPIVTSSKKAVAPLGKVTQAPVVAGANSRQIHPSVTDKPNKVSVTD